MGHGRQKGEGEGPGEEASRSSGHVHSMCAGRRGTDPEQKAHVGVVAGIRTALGRKRWIMGASIQAVGLDPMQSVKWRYWDVSLDGSVLEEGGTGSGF